MYEKINKIAVEWQKFLDSGYSEFKDELEIIFASIDPSNIKEKLKHNAIRQNVAFFSSLFKLHIKNIRFFLLPENKKKWWTFNEFYKSEFVLFLNSVYMFSDTIKEIEKLKLLNSYDDNLNEIIENSKNVFCQIAFLRKLLIHPISIKICKKDLSYLYSKNQLLRFSDILHFDVNNEKPVEKQDFKDFFAEVQNLKKKKK